MIYIEIVAAHDSEFPNTRLTSLCITVATNITLELNVFVSIGSHRFIYTEIMEKSLSFDSEMRLMVKCKW